MKILFLSHSLSRTGAPIVLLNFLIWLKNNHPSFKLHIIALEGGPLENEFRKNSTSLIIYKKNILEKTFNYLTKSKSQFKYIHLNKIIITKFKKFDLIYVNTIASLPLMELLFNPKNKIILHVHELEYAIKWHTVNIKKIKNYINKYIAVSNLVKTNLIENHSIEKEDIAVIHPPAKIQTDIEMDKDEEYFEVGGSGAIRWEKGVDIFVQLASYINYKYPNKKIKFTWVGKIPDFKKFMISYDLKKSNLFNKVHFTGELINPFAYYKNYDVFVLTSREDPFPLVCIEAGMLEKPIICFEKATGIQEVLKSGGGFIVPYLNIVEMAEKIIFYYENRDKLEHDGKMSKKLFSEFSPEKIYPKLFEIIQKELIN